jgi:hypothetical protein
MPRHTALIVPVPEAEPWIGELRRAHVASAARGIPPHVTVLAWFADAEDVDEGAVAEVLSAFRAFDFTLDRVERFDGGTTWLRPVPAEPFNELTRAVWRRWPEYPPYGGEFEELVPHLTVSQTPIDVAVPLPIACRAREVLLVEEDAPDGRWSTRLRVPLR